MTVYRLALSAFADDLAGTGSAIYGGRWNPKDVSLLYTSESRALCLLESLAHTGAKNSLLPRMLIELKLPPRLRIMKMNDQLEPGWQQDLEYTRAIGAQFVRDLKFPIMKVPSVLVEEESNFLLNPQHPLLQNKMIQAKRHFQFDGRLFA